MSITITEMKAREQEKGQNFFSKSTMDFFNSVIETKPNRQNIFITSERMEKYDPKKYAIRYFDYETGKVVTIGQTRQYNSLEEARQARDYITKLLDQNVSIDYIINNY